MMYELTGKLLPNISFTADGKPLVTLQINERAFAMQLMDDLNLKEKLAITIDEYKELRSTRANAYAWTLIGKIANKMRVSKDDIHLLMLKRYGQSDLVSVRADIPVRHYFKYYEEAGESTLNGKLFKHYRVYKGSSEMDTREMSIYIDGIISEAKELGISTDTPEQIEKMKSLWRPL